MTKNAARNANANLVNAKKTKIKKKSRLDSSLLNKTSQTTLKLTNLDMAITELSAIASTVSSANSKVSPELIPAVSAAFTKIIAYLNKLKQIGTGMPNTLQGIPGESDVATIAASGLISNQLFINSLCQLLRIQNVPKIIIQEETQE